MSCAVYGCENSITSVNASNSIQFFTFPDQEKMRTVWLNAILWKMPDPPRGSVICSDHFDERFFVKSTNKLKRLRKHSVPRILRKAKQLNTPQFVISQVTSTSALPPEECVDLTDMDDDMLPTVIVSTETQENDINMPSAAPPNSDTSLQMQMPFTMSSTEEIHLTKVISDAFEFNEPTPHIVLKSTVPIKNTTETTTSKRSYTRRASPPTLRVITPPNSTPLHIVNNSYENNNYCIIDNTSKSKFTNNINNIHYTNNINKSHINPPEENIKMSISVVSQLLNNSETNLGIDHASSNDIMDILRTDNPRINGFPVNDDIILFTLAKLKKNVSIENWSDMFNISKDTMLGLFGQMCGLLSNKMSCFVDWPPSDQIRLNLPMCFKNNYIVCESLIDIFEIRIDEPNTKLHKEITWSENIQSHSIKYLISCTPDGLINFVSEGFLGSTSIQDIVKKSGYLNGLKPEKGVLATQRFRTIEKDIRNQNSIFLRPASLLAKKILTEREEKINKQKLQLLIPITQLIKRLNQFEILRSVVNEEVQYYLDDIMIIICALLNLQHQIDYNNIKL